MPRLPRTRNRYLTCFYCGRKTSTPYDGATRCFDCPFCDATNYLDEHGDITDPPVATDREATPRQYAVPRARSPASPSSPPPASEPPIFCPTCLKNQHLLSASLAQYLPDPDDPDYAEREKGLYRFRKNQERLYPQICADCEPRVRRRLEQAAYTAKTDLLRRMLDRSATARKSTKSNGWLDIFDAVGRWLWIAGFVLQLVWHVVVVHGLLLHYFAWARADEELATFKLLRACAPWLARLPAADRLLGWSTMASLLGVWWNPRFAQIFRGFTRHISGVSKWYFFHAMAAAVRIGLSRADLTTPDPVLLSQQASAHAGAAFFAILIFFLAPRAIQINISPLFSANPAHAQQAPPQPQTDPNPSRPDETKSIADLLDEISRSPTSPTPPSPSTNLSPSPLQRRRTGPPMGHAHTQAAQSLSAPLQQLNRLHLRQHQQAQSPSQAYRNPRPAPSIADSEQDEMDWSPTPALSSPAQQLHHEVHEQAHTQSRHRAFNTLHNPRSSSSSSQSFGSTPTEPRKGPFWYRVPPAPTTPAQRVFNPPNRPRMRVSPAEGVRRGFGSALPSSSGGKGVGGGMFGTLKEEGDGEEGGGERQVVAFAEPSFFAVDVVGREGKGKAGGRGDPRDGLSGMFGEGFSLDGGGGTAAGDAGEGKAGGGWFGRLRSGRGRERKG